MAPPMVSERSPQYPGHDNPPLPSAISIEYEATLQSGELTSCLHCRDDSYVTMVLLAYHH
jgi:hypothetical protein